MPRPPMAICGHDSLYICDRCGRCVVHCCDCTPPGVAVSVMSQRGAIALRDARKRLRASSPDGMHELLCGCKFDLKTGEVKEHCEAHKGV